MVVAVEMAEAAMRWAGMAMCSPVILDTACCWRRDSTDSDTSRASSRSNSSSAAAECHDNITIGVV